LLEEKPVRKADILAMALSALWQQKVRTVLTTLGVVFGSFVLAASLSVGQGVQGAIERVARGNDFLRTISVHPNWRANDADPLASEVPVPGQMTEPKRERLRRAIIAQAQRMRTNTWVALTQEKLRELAALEHVKSVAPETYQNGYAIFDNKAQPAGVGAARPDSAELREQVVAGRVFDQPTERAVLLSEFLLYRYGFTDDEMVNSVLGKKIRLEFRGQQRDGGIFLHMYKPGRELSREEATALDKVQNQLPSVLGKLDLTAAEKDVLGKAIQTQPPSSTQVYGEEFTIVGVFRLPTAEENAAPYVRRRFDADVILPLQTATDLFFRVPGHGDHGVNLAEVIVDREENVEEVVRQITVLGLHHHALLEFIKRDRLMYALIFGAMTCIATVALLVAALGIANTMLMSVLERTREIGIMKAVGAGNGHLQLIFLVEGAFIGLLGGGLGLLLAWGASYPADSWIRSMVSRDLKIELEEAIFVFPLWLALAAPLVAVLVTTCAAVFPARRAARIDPVAALRHE
jgi:putative ABC transport system permease protein